MLRQMNKLWWKLLGAVLVLFSLSAGLLLPTGPGIVSALPSVAFSGNQIALDITGYNTHFVSADASTQVWLRHQAPGDTLYLCAQSLHAEGQDHLVAHFALPHPMPENHANKVFDLVVNNSTDGTFALLNHLTIRANENDSLTRNVPVDNCQVEVSNNDPAYLSLPYRIVLYETIRNLFFHVPMWFVMTVLLLFSFVYSIYFLRKGAFKHDFLAAELVNVALLFGILGFATGSLWGHYTWGNLGDWLLRDTKVLGALIALLMYLAYFVLRGSLQEEEKRARIGAVYNIFAFVLFIVFIYVLPRMTESLHPGSGGNPAFNIYDVDDNMRWIFYPAVVGWILMGLWITSIRTRMRYIDARLKE